MWSLLGNNKKLLLQAGMDGKYIVGQIGDRVFAFKSMVDSFVQRITSGQKMGQYKQHVIVCTIEVVALC